MSEKLKNTSRFFTKRLIETTNLTSRLTAIVSSIKAGALVQDTDFNYDNIYKLTSNGVIEGVETIRNTFCKSINEIINISEYLKENYDIPFPELKEESIINIENTKLDFLQLLENIDIVNDFSPEKLENLLTIIVSMGAISGVFWFLIPKILGEIKKKI